MRYVALLRGIGPSPHMSGANLRGVCEGLGFRNVQSVLTSGNLVFDANETNKAALQDLLEAAWPAQLGFTSTTIIKTQEEWQQLVAHNPFKSMTHSNSSYLLTTFFKHHTTPPFTLPHQPPGKPYTILGYYNNVLFSVSDNTIVKTNDLMIWLEKTFSKDITSRTWNTVLKIHNKL